MVEKSSDRGCVQAGPCAIAQVAFTEATSSPRRDVRRQIGMGGQELQITVVSCSDVEVVSALIVGGSQQERGIIRPSQHRVYQQR
jgi:hypothetical protein